MCVHVPLTDYVRTTGGRAAYSYGGPNTSGLVACEQPEAKANLRLNTQTVLSTLGLRVASSDLLRLVPTRSEVPFVHSFHVSVI